MGLFGTVLVSILHEIRKINPLNGSAARDAKSEEKNYTPQNRTSNQLSAYILSPTVPNRAYKMLLLEFV